MPFGAALSLSTLNGTNGYRLDGAAAGDRAGFSVASAGDVNGDGYADFLIGADQADPDGISAAGSTYVVFGTPDGQPATFALASLSGVNGFRIDGVAASDFAGYSVASAGDVNGDGFDDIIIGALGLDPNAVTSAGGAYVMFGKASWTPAVSLSSLNGTNGFRLDGAAEMDQTGYRVASAGDLNKDGFGDFIVSAWQADPGGNNNAGSSYILFGKATGWTSTLALSSLNGTNGFRLDGVVGIGSSGASVASAGDVNGDGIDDLIVGASVGSNPLNSGAAFVLFGKTSGWTPTIALSSLDGSNGFRLDGVGSGDNTGFSAASAGDVNGDGFGDLIIGAPFADPSGNANAGSAYVVFGKATGWAASLSLGSLDGTNGFRLEGGAAADRAGHSVAGAGDVNGDGFDDLIVGAYLADPGGAGQAGSSYVVFGKAAGWSSTLALGSLSAANGFRLDGVAANDQSGLSVASAGDVNGDGFADLVIGAYQADPGGNTDAGSSYIIYGETNVTGAVTRTGGVRADQLAGGASNDSLSGLDAADTLWGNGGDDSLAGGAGNDVLIGGAGGDTLDGGPGAADVAAYRGNGLTLFVSAPIYNAGDATGDVFVGIELFDFKRVTGIVVFYGSEATDSMVGGTNADLIWGNGGADRLDGGSENDFLLPGDGTDTIIGGDGFDAVYYGDSTSAISINLATGVHSGFAAGDSFASVEAFLLTEQGDTVIGADNGAAGDILYGLGGADSLVGQGGFDYLLGGDGADTLVGGFGWDLMIGGSGADRFVYETGGQGGTGEVISDFEVGIDKLAFVSASTGIAGFTLGQNLLIQAGAPSGLQGTTTGPTVYYDSTGGLLWFDTNGSTAGGLIFLGGLTGSPALTASDFIVV